jgi:alkaline phosphatase D
MIGTAQETWLKAGITASQARWNVIAQQTVFSPTPLGNFLNYDQWDGYPLARQRITDFLRARPQRNNVILTGDIHASGVAWVPGLTPGAPPTYSDPIATELVVTGISSAGLDPGTAALVQSVFQDFVHVQHFDPVAHGYQVHHVTHDEWRVDIRFVDTVEEDASDISTAASFVVVNGDPVAQPA